MRSVLSPSSPLIAAAVASRSRRAVMNNGCRSPAPPRVAILAKRRRRMMEGEVAADGDWVGVSRALFGGAEFSGIPHQGEGEEEESRARADRLKNKLKTVEIVEEGDCCVVCLKEIKLGAENVKAMVCNHIFHNDCISKWLVDMNKNTCPVCRHEMKI